MIKRMVDIELEEGRGRGMYYRRLQDKGKLKKIVDEQGYICVDTDDLDNYFKNVHRGRPVKKENKK